MANYKLMYVNLFGSVSDAIELLAPDHPARNILIDALQKAEEAYIDADDTPLRIVPKEEGGHKD